ncbi:MAG: chorismate synthase [Myxococcota bacterium]|nr:chorismate synthase [Myxococcota bacterium]
MGYGNILRLTTFGESHGKAIGGILEGVPPNIPIDTHRIQTALDRRKPGQSKLSSPRKESDIAQILSGVFEGRTLGTPIGFIIPNKDARPESYRPFKDQYRPSHADYTYDKKYGHRDWRGGGRSSARETATRVVAGSISLQILEQYAPIEIISWVEQIGTITSRTDASQVSTTQVESNLVRCPDQRVAAQMEELIIQTRKQKDTLGGRIRTVCRNVPAGLGEPVFDKLEAELAKAMLSIPACKGFSIGSGFKGTTMRGSEHNDPFIIHNGVIQTRSNHSGGIQGGISNGMNIEFELAFKPVSTIFQPQKSVSSEKEDCIINPRGRHDPCVLPRAVPIVEAMSALVLCDMLLRQQAITSLPFEQREYRGRNDDSQD